MVRNILGVIAGLAAWMVVATLVNLALRMLWAEYAAVEKALTFTLPMLFARLVIGFVASLVAGWIAARITGRSRVALWVVVGILLAVFLPTHVYLWDRFPAWYHAVFIASLVVVPWWGAALVSATARAPPTAAH